MVRVVRGIRGERAVPENPAHAPVWSGILNQIDEPGSQGLYVSVADVERTSLYQHPWSMGGGGAAELFEILSRHQRKLGDETTEIGRMAVLGEDDVWVAGSEHSSANPLAVPLVTGELIQHWQTESVPILYPYDKVGGKPLRPLPFSIYRRLFPYRTILRRRSVFGKTIAALGKEWFELLEHYTSKFSTPLSLAFAFVSTHNEFVFDRGGRLFNRSAPVIKFPDGTSEDEHIAVLGTLNSSAADFWLKQVCFPKGGDHVGSDGARIRKVMWEVYYEYDAAKLSQFPLPDTALAELATAIQQCADERTAILPASLVRRELPTRTSLDHARNQAQSLLNRMIALQEELDWQVYSLYSLTRESLTVSIDEVPEIELGQRAFEIVMARQMAEGELETEWFNRHGSTPITEMLSHWPKPYRKLVQQRLDTLGADRDIVLIEQPEYKRRWNLPSWDELETEALRNWLLDHLEGTSYWPTEPPLLRTVSNLAAAAAEDAKWMQVAELYTGRPDFKPEALVSELVAKESLPFLPVLRYKPSGLTKRKLWEETWALQRREDAGEQVDIPVPPKYEKVDLLTDIGWRLRGKLDVPKERWVSYPHLESNADSSLLIGWAGYDHAQQAIALATYYQSAREEGWPASRLKIILAGIQELLPWVMQWHNQPDATGTGTGDFVAEFLRNELSLLNLTQQDLREWAPIAAQRRTATRRGKQSNPAVEAMPQ